MKVLFARLNHLAHLASYRSDVVVASFMILAVVMMVIPMPTFLVDLLITVNIAFSLLILVVAFYIGRPSDFSSLPPIILLGTLFRLALSITTTRLILLQADAGEIVATFGRFVIGGEIVVGLVVFLIITAAQFIVITKGAERVAEVAARFTLDAMPGKQMSIDNDLRNGDIDQAEARARRSRLERESQLYGAMDGAMKFVKGDAITGLIIVFINLIGGLMIGMLSRGMSFADASHTYSLLTVGDGLISQIPALLISLAAGTVVTRVASETESDLGTEIFRQLGSSERALALSATILCAGAFVPGFPTVTFLAIGGGLGLIAFLKSRKKRSERTDVVIAEEPVEADTDYSVASDDSTPLLSSGSTRHSVVLHLGSDLSELFSALRFQTEIDAVRTTLREDLGLEFPAVELRTIPSFSPEKFRFDLEGVPVSEGEIPANGMMLNDDPMHLDLLQIPYEDGPALLQSSRNVWVDAEHLSSLNEAGIGVFDPVEVIAQLSAQTLRRYAAHFVGIQETRELLTTMEDQYSELVKESARVVPLNKLSDILRRLVEEDVPIGNLRVILEALVEWGSRETDPSLLAERVRGALARQICHRHAQLNRVISAYVLARSTEEMIRNSIKQTGVGAVLTLPDEVSRSILNQVKRDLDTRSDRGAPVVITSLDLRRLMRNFLLRNDINLPVLSYQEIASEYSVQAVMSVTLPSHNRNRSMKPLEHSGESATSEPALVSGPV